MRQFFFLLFGFFLFFSCSEENKEDSNQSNSSQQKVNYRKLGKQITSISQKTLLQHVGSAMKMGGPIAAIQYCNINAIAITDSLSNANNVAISRISEKNRNPKNALTAFDFEIWNHYKSGKINVQMKDSLIDLSDKSIYYKPIYIANPTCLHCHGEPGTDIMDLTIAKIDEYYTDDKARNYKLGELRGLWKLEFKK